MEKKISIILPVYNSENTVSDTIESIIKQTYTNFELLIIDDGSKDNTKKVCEKFIKDKRIKVISINNSGVSFARNIGLEKADGSYIAFIDSDDKYKENFLEKMIYAIEKENADLCISGYIGVNEKNRKEKNITNVNMFVEKSGIGKIIEFTQGKNLFNQVWNKLFKTDIIRKNKIVFDKNLAFGEDYKFVLEYISKINNLVTIEETLYYYTNSTNGLNSKFVKDRFESNLQNFFSLEKIFDDNEFDKTYLDKKFVRMCLSEIEHINIMSNSKAEKLEGIKQFVNDERVINRTAKIQKYIWFKKIILNKNIKIISLLMVLLEGYDKLEKKIKLGY